MSVHKLTNESNNTVLLIMRLDMLYFKFPDHLLADAFAVYAVRANQYPFAVPSLTRTA